MNVIDFRPTLYRKWVTSYVSEILEPKEKKQSVKLSIIQARRSAPQHFDFHHLQFLCLFLM